MKTKTVAAILLLSTSLFANFHDKSIWLNFKIPEIGLVYVDNAIPCFSTEISGEINNKLLKLTFSLGEEMNIDVPRPTASLTEVSLCYGYLWKWNHFHFDVCAGIGIEKGNLRWKYNRNAIYRSEQYELNTKTNPIFKGILNLNYVITNRITLGTFLEPFSIGSHAGFFAGLSMNYCVYK